MVFYCEQAAGYCADIGYQEEGFFDALVRMFEQALNAAKMLPAAGLDSVIARLNRVREISHTLGTGSGDDMDYMLPKHVNAPLLGVTSKPAGGHRPALRRLAENATGAAFSECSPTQII